MRIVNGSGGGGNKGGKRGTKGQFTAKFKAVCIVNIFNCFALFIFCCTTRRMRNVCNYRC